MIITESKPFSKTQILNLREEFDIYIKTVIDLKRQICSAGCNLHTDSEEVLIKNGSNQKDIWGGGINLETLEIDFNSFINIRPKQENKGIEILDNNLRNKYETLSKYFFKVIYDE